MEARAVCVRNVLEKTRAQETPMKPKKAADSEHAKAAKTGARAIVKVYSNATLWERKTNK